MTISSMTGYAVRTRETPSGTLTIEIKSVNSRFLDLQFRINDDLRALEPLLRESVMGRVLRGKVECRLSFGRASTSGNEQALNEDLLASLSALQDKVRSRFVDALPFSVNELLRWPGVIADAEIGQESLQADTAAAMTTALDAFLESRQREGAALEAVLVARITELEDIVTRITPLVPQVVAQFQQKAVDRMREALGIALSGDNAPNTAATGSAPASPPEEMVDRIRQEVTLYGMRIDVSEELARLSAHLTETRHILKKGGQVGKRLDFMMQELNREANTVGSKAAIKELSDASMAMKLLIEQMREQVQNLE
ncbi:MAG: YicC family protein [Herminiimonas sp.]|nr:YicC family protein [Herminiimonas sp.]MDB5852751.1 YicC family protein [Herminiimonas sp.]